MEEDIADGIDSCDRNCGEYHQHSRGRVALGRDEHVPQRIEGHEFERLSHRIREERDVNKIVLSIEEFEVVETT